MTREIRENNSLYTIYATIFTIFGLGAKIREGLISRFWWCFHYYKLKKIEVEIFARS